MTPEIQILSAPEADRRTRILAAAERAFARHGFHGASMQHVAAEAQMSAGNLYRYFPSKEAIVAGLAELDRTEMAGDFETMASASDVIVAAECILRKHLVDWPMERNRLVLEIWAEATRNAVVAELCLALHRDVQAGLGAVIRRAVAGRPVGQADVDFIVRLMMTVMSGLLKRRATEPDFDGEAEVGLALAVFRAALDGRLAPAVAAPATEIVP